MADPILVVPDPDPWTARLLALEQYLRDQARADLYWRSAVATLAAADLLNRVRRDGTADDGARQV